MGQAQVLIVSCKEKNAELMADFIQNHGYEVTVANTVDKVVEVLEESKTSAVALVDADGFGSEAFEIFKSLREKGFSFALISQNVKKIRDSSERVGGTIMEKPMGKKAMLNLIEALCDECED